MQYLYTFFFFVFGLVTASFLNAQSYRWKKNFKFKKLLTLPSQCEHCGKRLKWYEMVPVISYMFQKGVCGKCKEKISIYYPISELFLGLSFGAMYYVNTPWYAYIVLCFLFMMAYWDYVVMGFPKILAHLLLSFTIIIYLIKYLDGGYLFALDTGLISGIVFALLFSVMNLFYKKKAFGAGDMFVIVAVCMTLSFKQSIMFMICSVFTAVIYGIVYAVKNKRDLKFNIPFVIFLMIGFVLSLIFALPSYIC